MAFYATKEVKKGENYGEGDRPFFTPIRNTCKWKENCQEHVKS